MDEVLFQKIQNKDLDAFRELTDKYQDYVFQIAYRFLAIREEAEDVVQEVFLKIYTRAGQYQGKGSVRSFIYKIAVNESLNRIRSRFRAKQVPLNPEWADRKVSMPLEICENKELCAVLEQALDELPERQKVAFILKTHAGLSYDKIGEVLDCTRVAVEGLIFRARQQLQQNVKLCQQAKNFVQMKGQEPYEV